MMRPLLSSLHQQRRQEHKNMADGKNGAREENADQVENEIIISEM
jgi:hypothetical protein